MNLPTTELNDLYHLGTVCLNHCVANNGVERLSWIGASVYPLLMSLIVNTTGQLYLYMKETDGQTPYFAGAGSEFIEQLSRVKDFGIEIQRNHIPRRYHNSTGKNSFCQSSEEAQEYNKLKATIQNFLNNNKIQGQIEELETSPLKANDLEFKSWINSLFLMSNSLLKKIETPTDQEILKAYQIRRMAYNTENEARLKKELNSLFRRSDDCLLRKLPEDLEKIYAIQDPFWQKILQQAFDPVTKTFRGKDIASILYEHRQELLTNDKFDHIAYKLLYICENIFIKQKELENPSTKLSFQMESIQPADLSKFPHLNMILPAIIKNDRILFEMFKNGVLKSETIVTKGKGEVCRFSHLYRFLYDNGIILHLDLVKTSFAEAILEILKESGNSNWKKAKQITDNINNNIAVLDTNRPIKRIDKSFCEIIGGFFDQKLIQALRKD